MAQVVERWNSLGRVRVDLFGVIDIVAVKDGAVRWVQVTSSSNISSHRKKILESEAIKHVRSIEMWGWRKKSNRWIYSIADAP